MYLKFFLLINYMHMCPLLHVNVPIVIFPVYLQNKTIRLFYKCFLLSKNKNKTNVENISSNRLYMYIYIFLVSITIKKIISQVLFTSLSGVRAQKHVRTKIHTPPPTHPEVKIKVIVNYIYLFVA